MDKSYVLDDNYRIADAILYYFKTSNRASLSSLELADAVKESEDKINAAINLIQNELGVFRITKGDSHYQYYIIMPPALQSKAMLFIDAGGFLKKYIDEKEKDDRKGKIEELTMEQLKVTIEQAKKAIKDSEHSRIMASWSLFFAGLAALISIIAFFIRN